MAADRRMSVPVPADNPLHISWSDNSWISILSPENILDYFTGSPFYDRTCNNEIIKMQRLNPEHLTNMTGIEYELIHAQEPILYVVRKQRRMGPSQIFPLADYYCIAGTFYQAPDLASVINSRLLSVEANLQSAFEEAVGFARFNPTKGYSWDFGKEQNDDAEKEEEKKKKKQKESEVSGSWFQRQRVDFLLAELSKAFPDKYATLPPAANTPPQPTGAQAPEKTNEVKSEPKPANNDSMRPPPEKKPKR